uniref:Uncharacterized protein n=1 Tax=Sciurus vulgaris TaxID=55149 RepID=A0A8D2B8G3_SCIVU
MYVGLWGQSPPSIQPKCACKVGCLELTPFHPAPLGIQLPGSLSFPGFSEDLFMLDNVIHQRKSPSFSSYP